MTSPFLSIAPTQYIARNILAFAVFDRFPVSPGHALIIPFRHVATWFDATRLEQESIFALVDLLKKRFDQGVLFPDGSTHTPDGYNVGFNAGEAAGQTVMHLHVHLIPRYRGDMHDPRGGVRHVIPEKGIILNQILKSPMQTKNPAPSSPLDSPKIR
jgi:diadenosine tetraphosphate (Ap4A) HIT family hydrolase